MSNLRILMVTLGMPPKSLGGTEYYTLNLSNSLIECGHHVGVFCAETDLSKKRYTLTHHKANGLDVYSVSNSHLYARKFQDFFIDEKIDQIFGTLLTTFKPDIVHFHHLAYLSGRLPQVAHALNIPSIMTLHDYWYMCFRSRLLRPDNSICAGPNNGKNCASCDDHKAPNPIKIAKHPTLLQLLNTPRIKKIVEQGLRVVPQDQIVTIRKSIVGTEPASKSENIEPSQEEISNQLFRSSFFKKQLEFPDRVISPSAHLKGRYEKAGFRDIATLPLGFNPVSPLAQLPFNEILKISYIGSIEHHKGLLLLLEELLLMGNLTNKIELNIYGNSKDPIYGAKVRKKANELPRGTVRFHGKYDSNKDLNSIFQNCHFAIFPSIWEENHPLVIREALLHGKPVIASNLGGVTEIVVDKVNGIIFDPLVTGDFSKQLKQIFNKKNLLTILSEGARNTKIETMQIHAKKVSDIYTQAILDVQSNLEILNSADNLKTI